MNGWRSDCLERLMPISGSSADLLRQLEMIATELEFEYCSYVMTVPIPITKPSMVWSSNYPARWVDRYLSSKYLDIDPIVRRAENDVRPLVWSSDLFEEQPEFWEDARAYGIRYGWALAVHGPHRATGLLSLARSHQPIGVFELDEKEMKLVWLSHVIQAMVGAAESKTRVPESAYQLTDREREVLRWSAAGKTAEEIGTILGITGRTVTFHVTASLCKLDVTNKTQAVAKALILGLI